MGMTKCQEVSEVCSLRTVYHKHQSVRLSVLKALLLVGQSWESTTLHVLQEHVY